MPAYDQFLEPLATAEEMRRWDEESVKMGIPGTMLMENAAQAALRVLLASIPDLAGKKAAVLMGGGNNGGDAVCLARLMLDMGADVTVFHLPPLEKIRGDALFHLELARNCGVSLRPAVSGDAASFDADCDILIDGLLGTGFSGTLRQDCQDIITLCNQKKKYREFTLALDIPSGLDCNEGTPSPCAIEADATVTFAAAKPGLVMPCAKHYTGTLHTAYIGTPKKARSTPKLHLLSAKILRQLPPVRSGGYKNAYGHVVIIGGAHGMGGAAHIAALAALKSGCGLVTVVSPLSWTDSVRLGHPEIMTFGLDSHGSSTDWPDCVPERLKGLIERADSFVIGPGMGRGEDARNFVAACLKALPDKPVVIDADALHFLPQLEGVLHNGFLKDGRHLVLTPHAGEARALLEGACASLPDSPSDTMHAIAARYKCTVVLKGAGTWVTGRGLPDAFYPYDIPQLSMGGSGDCLAGVCGSLLAQNARNDMSQDLDRILTLSAMESVAWHGTAGRLLQKKYPERGCLSSDLVSMLPKVRRLLSEGTLEKVLGKVFERC